MKSTITSVYLDKEALHRAKEMARRNRRSLSFFVREAIEEKLEADEQTTNEKHHGTIHSES
jgi:predicted transcriptional regulator